MIRKTTDHTEKGFGAAFVLLALIVIAIIGAAGWFVLKNAGNKENPAGRSTAQVSSFEECVSSGSGYPIEDNLVADSRGSGTTMTTISCHSKEQNKTFYAEFDRCDQVTCKDLDKALLSFCNNEYKELRAGDISGTFLMKSHEAALLKNSYARGNISCYKNTDDIQNVASLIVFYKLIDTKWTHVYTYRSDTTCTDMDKLGIPLAIAGACYDKVAGGWRSPKL